MEELIENSVISITLIGVCLKIKTIIGRRNALSDAFELLLSTEIYRIKCEETKKFDIEGEKKSRFSRRFNDIFSSIIFVQFSISTLVLCVSVQTLTMLSFMSMEFIIVMTYLACMLAQIFVLCWYANEVTLNSLNVRTAVYNMNWYSLSLKTQKDLLLIIARSSYPITFTGGPIVTLSLDSFVS
ncbi:hypothetical protein PV326_000899, partial [Microctonus aethiopoides]